MCRTGYNRACRQAWVMHGSSMREGEGSPVQSMHEPLVSQNIIWTTWLPACLHEHASICKRTSCAALMSLKVRAWCCMALCDMAWHGMVCSAPSRYGQAHAIHPCICGVLVLHGAEHPVYHAGLAPGLHPHLLKAHKHDLARNHGHRSLEEQPQLC